MLTDTSTQPCGFPRKDSEVRKRTGAVHFHVQYKARRPEELWRAPARCSTPAGFGSSRRLGVELSTAPQGRFPPCRRRGFSLGRSRARIHIYPAAHARRRTYVVVLVGAKLLWARGSETRRSTAPPSIRTEHLHPHAGEQTISPPRRPSGTIQPRRQALLRRDRRRTPAPLPSCRCAVQRGVWTQVETSDS